MKNLIPTLLKILDLIPLKGYRTLTFFGLTAATLALGHFNVLKPDVVDPLVTGLVGALGYFAGKHEPEEK